MAYSSKFVVQQMRLAIIGALPGRRSINQETVDRLATSMAKLGLRQPITITSSAQGRLYRVVTGAHRLAAARKLGWETIPCYIEKLSKVDSRLWEISENLDRAELLVGERADQIAEWIRLTETKVEQVAPVSPGGRGNTGGVRAAARELGVDRDEARRAVKIASITPEAREAAREAGLDDNQSALLRIAGAPAEAQVEAVEKIVKAKAEKPKRESQSGTLGATATRATPPELFASILPTLDSWSVETADQLLMLVADYVNGRTGEIEPVPEPVADPEQTQGAGRLKLLREQAEKNGLRLVKRGSEYRLIREDGTEAGHVDLDSVEGDLDAAEGKIAVQLYTFCGTPYAGWNNSQAWLAAHPGKTMEDFERALPPAPSGCGLAEPVVDQPESEPSDLAKKMAAAENEPVGVLEGQPLSQHSAAARAAGTEQPAPTVLKKATKKAGAVIRPDIAAYCAANGQTVSPRAAA